jgi:hypothetical protein
MSLPRTPQLVQEAKRLRLENGDLRGHNAHLQEDNTRLVHKQNELLLTISTLQDAHMKLQEARIWQLESGQAAVVARPAAPAAPATPVASAAPATTAAPAAPAITPSRKRKAGGVERVSVTMSAGARQQAQAEGLTLRVADNGTGYFGVCLAFPGQPRPYKARVRRDGKLVHLGTFATAEEAALCVARSLEGRAVAAKQAAAVAAKQAAAVAAKQAAAVAPLTSQEARQQAQAEGLTLRVAESTTGYFGVCLAFPGQPRPYKAQVSRGGKRVHLGSFATAEEAALCVARSLEGRAVAARAAAAAESQGMPPTVPSGTSGKEERVVPPMPPDAFVKVEVVV